MKKFVTGVVLALLMGTAGLNIATATTNSGIIGPDKWTTSLSISIRNNGNSFASSQTKVDVGDYQINQTSYTAKTSVTYKINGTLFQTKSGTGSRSWPFATATANAQTSDYAPVPAGTTLSATSTHSYTKGSLHDIQNSVGGDIQATLGLAGRKKRG